MRKMSRILVVGVALLPASGCKPLDDTMVAIFGRSMRNQRSFDPYENTRPAPEHSISFASGNFPSARGGVNIGQPVGLEEDLPPFEPADMAPPGTEVVTSLVNPVVADSASLARGNEMFDRFCAVCHGPDGIGAHAYIAAKHPVLPAYNVAGDRVQGYSDGYIYGMIRIGRGIMPEYGSRISHFDRWNIVNYVRELQREYNETNPGGGS